mgnify:CR=1 FL=1
MELAKALCIQPGVTAIIGSGGKTSAMLRLARELGRAARVIVCTSTRILPPEGLPLLQEPDAERAAEILESERILCAGTPAEKGKLAAPGLAFSQLAALAEYVLVEADGSKRLPVKAHAAYEPVIPPEANQTVCVFGLSGVGLPICEAAHRAELYAKNLNVSPETILTPQLAAAHLNLEGLHTRVLLNQADVPGGRDAARAMAELIQTPVCMASLREEWAECLS